MGVQSPKQIHGIFSEKPLFFSKKNAPNSLKSKINLTFISHLVVGGWGPMFGKKSQKNRFFLDTFPSFRYPFSKAQVNRTPIFEAYALVFSQQDSGILKCLHY